MIFTSTLIFINEPGDSTIHLQAGPRGEEFMKSIFNAFDLSAMFNTVVFNIYICINASSSSCARHASMAACNGNADYRMSDSYVSISGKM